MRVSANEKLIKNRRRLGTYTSIAGLGVLVVGMIVSFRGQYVWVSFIALIIGFILAQFGTYNLRQWGRSPRPDQVIETALKGFDDRYHLYAWTLPAPLVLLSPQGIYSFTTKDQTGEITVNGSQWRSKFSLSRVLTLFAQGGMGNPGNEASDNANQVKKWLDEKAPELAAAVQPVVVFIDERAQLTVSEPAVPVLTPAGLKKWMRGAGKGANLKNADYKALETLFDARAGGTSA
jgi:hypothetical protein